MIRMFLKYTFMFPRYIEANALYSIPQKSNLITARVMMLSFTQGWKSSLKHLQVEAVALLSRPRGISRAIPIHRTVPQRLLLCCGNPTKKPGLAGPMDRSKSKPGQLWQFRPDPPPPVSGHHAG
jgi:hypothetical protein